MTPSQIVHLVWSLSFSPAFCSVHSEAEMICCLPGQLSHLTGSVGEVLIYACIHMTTYMNMYVRTCVLFMHEHVHVVWLVIACL